MTSNGKTEEEEDAVIHDIEKIAEGLENSVVDIREIVNRMREQRIAFRKDMGS